MKVTHTYFTMLILGLLSLSLAACSGTDTQPTVSSTPAAVNGFGSAANHVHSLLALPNHVLILATHYGIFRSEDAGTSWKEVAGGDNQLMKGIMTYSLGYSPLNLQRLYVATQLVDFHHHDTLGLYTSADQGRTWKLAIATASLQTSSIFMEEPGNDTADQVYIYLRDMGAAGLRVSMDNGQHFSATSTLPFGSIFGLLALPGASGQLLAYGSDGVARSTDSGAHWQVLQGISAGINEMVIAGSQRNSPIYASGDNGIYSSLDGGRTLALVYSQASYTSLAVSPAQPQVLYGETGQAIYRSANGGRAWEALPHIAGHFAKIAVDPGTASQGTATAGSVYLSLSYPTAIYQLASNNTAWQSLTPKA